MDINIGDFFDKNNLATSSGSENFNDIIEMAKGMARCTSMCVYLIDYATKNFLWFSDNLSIFSCKSNEELREMGYEIFLKNVPEDEQRMLLEINRAGWELFRVSRQTNVLTIPLIIVSISLWTSERCW